MKNKKALVFKGLMLLGAITIVEVFIALLAKGHMIQGIKFKHGIRPLHLHAPDGRVFAV
ncbi:MAG: hypothetical protein IPL27_08735 [Lewinellaceae bacterium]|nr:hypothetical protein [Lewinellaceae bacterium]